MRIEEFKNLTAKQVRLLIEAGHAEVSVSKFAAILTSSIAAGAAGAAGLLADPARLRADAIAFLSDPAVENQTLSSLFGMQSNTGGRTSRSIYSMHTIRTINAQVVEQSGEERVEERVSPTLIDYGYCTVGGYGSLIFAITLPSVDLDVVRQLEAAARPAEAAAAARPAP